MHRKIVLDVSPKKDYAFEHVKGSVHYEVQSLVYGKIPRIPKAAEISVYCRYGGRSKLAVYILKNNGFSNVRDLGAKENVKNSGYVFVH